MEELFGLIDSKLKQPLPLDKIVVDVKIKGSAASILSELHYVNKGEQPIEVVFVFPLEDRVSVCGFQVKIEGKIIKGKVEEKEEARDTYDDAISSGKSAFLLEESNDSPDIFKISVGNLPGKTTANVQIRCVVALKIAKDGSVIFTLPTVLNPRYCSESKMGDCDNWTAKSSKVPFVKLPYDFCFDMQVEVGSEIEEIFSETDKLKITIDDEDKRKAVVKVDGGLQFNHDIEVAIKQKSPFSAHVFTEKGRQVLSAAQNKDETSWEQCFQNLSVVMLNFLPKFQSPPSTDSQFPSEFIFVIDRSGSMSGSNIQSAKEALLLFLKSLPVNSYFDIISFGDWYQSFFGKSEEYTDENLTKACNFVAKLEADMGGTAILGPLQHVYARQKDTKGKLKQNVFLLTDGDVSNTREVINLVKENAAKSWCFALGIGHGASTALVNGVAKAGGGLADFARSDERLQKKVICMLQRACKPRAENIMINWNMSNNFQFKQIPDTIDFLHDKEFLAVYGVITSPVRNEISGIVTLEYNIEGRKHKEDLSFNIESDAEDETKHLSLHALAAKDYITQFNQYNPTVSLLIKDNIIKLSKASGVISKYTSYIAVDEVTQDPIQGPMICYNGSRSGSRSRSRSRRVDKSRREDKRRSSRKGNRSSRSGDRSRRSRDISSRSWSRDRSKSSRSRDRSRSRSRRSRDRSSRSWSRGRSKMSRDRSSRSWSRDRSRSPLIRNESIEFESDESDENVNRSHFGLVSLQCASGKWALTKEFSSELGNNHQELISTIPAYLLGSSSNANDINATWATILAIVWLKNKQFDLVQDELCMIIEKAEVWLLSHVPAGITRDQIAQDAKKTLA